MLLAEAATPAGASLRAILAALVPVHGGRLVQLPVVAAPAVAPPPAAQADDRTTIGAGFVTVEGAVAAAAAVLRELRDERLDDARFVLCHRPDLPNGDEAIGAAVDDALRLLRDAPEGSLVLSPEAAAALARDPGPNLRALELLALDGGTAIGGSWAVAELVPASLDEVGRRRQARVGGLRYTGRRRRPSGEREPLPRDLRLSGRIAVLVAVAIAGLWASLFLVPGAVDWWQARDDQLLARVVARRREVWTDLATAIAWLSSPWFWRPLRLATLLVLLVFRRWRHLLVALLALFVLETVVEAMAVAIGRPRPLVPILTSWEGYAHPSSPVASLTVTLTIAGLALLPRGRWRRVVTLVGTLLVAAVVLARLYLGVDHLTDGVVAALLGAAVPLVAFRTLAPSQVFPVRYRRGGRGAHLDIDARRSDAIRRAVSDQLGLEVVAIEPFGLEASGGSTPLRLTVEGETGGERLLFAKLYSTSHLRADRWYKAARTILYGSLEDELRHPSVRRLVEREDYLLLLMRQAGIPCARSFGVVEITPEREYLTVTEFIEEAQEISRAEVDEQIIDEALMVVRRLWDAGLAHRDIKPGNVLVQDGHVRLVDVAFAMVRPSPWRQAVDLANMMLILALRTSPEQVYRRALRFFAPEDIAEAFAATRSVTIPSESRSSLRLLARTEGLDLVARFRELAPDREPISIQRFSRRRILLTLAALAVIVLLLPILVENLTGGGFL